MAMDIILQSGFAPKSKISLVIDQGHCFLSGAVV
jgi:hypothetical protein